MARFEEPVQVTLGPAKNVIHVVTRLGQAIDILLNKGPLKGGPKHLAAREACYNAVIGREWPEIAREAFAEAAKEADILR
jgi:hypothetical protein